MKNILPTISLILFFALFQSCTDPSFQQNIQMDVSSNGFLKEVDSIVVNNVNQYNIPGLSIGIIQNDSILYSKGFGVRSIENESPVTGNTIFHTASISKLFTASAVMTLVEQGKITINDKLVEILPHLNYDDSRVEDITLKQLLNHTSGLPDINDYHWSNNHQSDNSLEQYVLGLNLELDAQPASAYRYSNLGYDILGYVIEILSGSTFDEYLKANILTRSGMYSSDFRYFRIPDSLRTRPHSKRWITENIYIRDTYPYTREHAPSSTLNASSEDLSTWMISFLQKLDAADSGSVYLAMTEPSFSAYPYIGLGFQLSILNGKKTIGHYGGDKGFRSYLIMIPDEKIGLVLLANCDYNEDFRHEILHPIANLMLTKYNQR